MIWAAQILCGNAILGYSVVFLQDAGFSELQAFDINIALSACYIVGGIICWFLFPHVGRATIYMSGLTFMFFCLITIGGLAWGPGKDAQLAIGILLVIATLCNMIAIGPTCYPIVAETPSGRLRYKTITIGRFVYNLTSIFSNSVTPRMLSVTCKYHPWLASLISTNNGQLGTGAPKRPSSTLEQTYYVMYGAGSDCLRPRIEPLERLTFFSPMAFRPGNSSRLMLIASPL